MGESENQSFDNAETIITGRAQTPVMVRGELKPIKDTEPQPAREDATFHPLSHGQQALWFLQQLVPNGSALSIVHAVRLRGEVDREAIRRALQGLVNRHEALRTTFSVVQGLPAQVVHRQVEMAYEEVDASLWSPAKLHNRLVEEVYLPLDLEKSPPVRRTILNCSATEHILLVAIHHIVTDLWSMALLLHELGILYRAEKTGTVAAVKDLSVQYVDHVREQAEMLAGPEGERLWSYWRRKLAGDLPTLDLPVDRPRPLIQSHRGAVQTDTLDARLVQRLKVLAKANKTNLYTVLLAAFEVLLHRYTRQEDILLGFLKSGRSAKFARTVGYFVNPLVLRGDLSANPTFAEVLERLRRDLAEAFEHDAFPFSLLVERLQPTRDLSRSPIFQVAFNYQKTTQLVNKQVMASIALSEGGQGFNAGGLSMETIALTERMVQFDLVLSIADTDEGLLASLEYVTDLFDAATITRMLGHFKVLLEGIVTDVNQGISTLPLLTEGERGRLLAEWSDTRAEYPWHQRAHELFEAQVERTPNAVAVEFEDQRLTYSDLNLRANQLAHHLRDLGVGPEVLVGICVERSLEMVIGLLGTLKAGGGYVPLDPSYPRERLAFMIEDARVAVLLTQERLLGVLPTQRTPVVCLDSDCRRISTMDGENPAGGATLGNLAYVIFSSGSTGKPKGVQVPHRALVNFCHNMAHQLGISDRDTLLAVTTISFDIAALELILPLTVGARVVVASRSTTRDGKRLQELISRSGATFMQATPATWRLLLETGWPDERTRLNILCGGEAFPQDLAGKLSRRGNSLWNLYGPTETTIWSAACRVNPESIPVSIGRPIANTQILLLDEHLNPVPVGVPGELHIAGDGLARGYLNRPDLTGERFIPNPFGDEPGAMLYRTGDLARFLPDGTIEYLGRLDQQVKIRGFRVELGEIEATLAEHPAVKEAIALLREDVPGDKRLVAYFVPVAGNETKAGELRAFLQGKLPDYMLPSAYVLLDVLPLTPNGKVDRKALPPPDRERSGLPGVFVAPRTPVEEELADLWRKLLRVDRVGINDNFFELGGHSLLATQLVSQLRDSFHVEVPLLSLFETPTIDGLALAIAECQARQVEPEQLDQLLDEIEQLSGDHLQGLLASAALP